MILLLSSGAFDQLKQNATKARIPFYGRWVPPQWSDRWSPLLTHLWVTPVLCSVTQRWTRWWSLQREWRSSKARTLRSSSWTRAVDTNRKTRCSRRCCKSPTLWWVPESTASTWTHHHCVSLVSDCLYLCFHSNQTTLCMWWMHRSVRPVSLRRKPSKTKWTWRLWSSPNWTDTPKEEELWARKTASIFFFCFLSMLVTSAVSETTHCYIVHYIVSTPFCSAVRMSSRSYWTLYSDSEVFSRQAPTKQYFTSCIAR